MLDKPKKRGGDDSDADKKPAARKKRRYGPVPPPKVPGLLLARRSERVAARRGRSAHFEEGLTVFDRVSSTEQARLGGPMISPRASSRPR